MISRVDYLRRFEKSFGDFYVGALDAMTALMCIRTKAADGDWYYGAPFIVRDPMQFYFQMANVDSDIFDRMFDCKAELCHIGEWSDKSGLIPFNSEDVVCVAFSYLFDKKEDSE